MTFEVPLGGLAHFCPQPLFPEGRALQALSLLSFTPFIGMSLIHHEYILHHVYT